MAVAAGARAGSLGLDVERCTPEWPGIERRVLTPAEAERIAPLSDVTRWRAVLALFCAKEAGIQGLDEIIGGPALTFRSLEVIHAADVVVIVRGLAAPTIAAIVAVAVALALAQDDDLSVAIATT